MCFETTGNKLFECNVNNRETKFQKIKMQHKCICNENASYSSFIIRENFLSSQFNMQDKQQQKEFQVKVMIKLIINRFPGIYAQFVSYFVLNKKEMKTIDDALKFY